MNREEFMRQLEQMLGGISESERREALSFYQGYFDDAGPENEGAVIRELGSPGKAAAIIKADLNSSSRDYGQFTEHGFVDDRIKDEDNMPQPSSQKEQAKDEGKSGTYSQTGNSYGGPYGSYTGESRSGKRYRDPRGRSGGNLLLIIIVILVLAPLILGLGAGAVGAAFGVLAGALAIVLGIVLSVIGCLVGGIASIVWGVIQCFVSPGVGVLAIGTGSLAIALGVLGIILLAWLFGKAVPCLVRKLVGFCSRLLHNGRGGARV